MSYTVTRHRGGGRDGDDNPIPWTPHALTAEAIAPAAGTVYAERARDGESLECVVYFRPAVDLTSDDELTVDGIRYRIRVEQWRPRRGRASRTGTVALCLRKEG
ncbi:head-tail adaptor protein [Nocardia farcinica]|uniref:hypothetical protein n=1 Tax=Nocardia farcinica TaxID=37329 RepID=UPI001895535F|nr:hypothetical protein [Nocardia farcinica]MBF6411205.1 hypothetical protein [Nocardia farcinica]